MNTILILFTIIGLMGAFDTLYHHEFKERLPWRPQVKSELQIHALRNVFYTLIFFSLAWVQWQGVFAWIFLAILLAEIFVTFTDFALESKVRDVPAPEIIVHTALGIVYGAVLANLIPEVLKWKELESGFTFVNYGFFSFVLTMYALAVLVFAFRDYFRSLEIDNFRQTYSMNLTTPNQKVLITGGSGFIGSKVAQSLIDNGHDVTVVTRNFEKSIQKFSKQIRLVESLKNLSGSFDIVLNFTGETINQRWCEQSKATIRESRLQMTTELVNYLEQRNIKPKVLISSSGTGIYPASLTESFTESSTLDKSSFTAKLCQEWEAKANEAESLGVRVVILRTGLVLAIDGGVLSEMLTPFDLCLGGKLGSGEQMMPWIDMHDMLGIIEHLINNETIKGAVNATAPLPVNNLEFSQTLAKSLKRPLLLPTPTFMLKLLYGKEMVQELLLEGRAVSPKKVEENGYQFKFKTLEQSLHNLFNKEK